MLTQAAKGREAPWRGRHRCVLRGGCYRPAEGEDQQEPKGGRHGEERQGLPAGMIVRHQRLAEPGPLMPLSTRAATETKSTVGATPYSPITWFSRAGVKNARAADSDS